MASSRPALTAVSSPMARPGRRVPPSPGVSDAASAKSARTGSAQASQGGGARTTRTSPETRMRKLVASPGSVGRGVPRRSIRAPSARARAWCSSAPARTVRGMAAGTSSTRSAVPRRLQRGRPSKPAPMRCGMRSMRSVRETGVEVRAASVRDGVVREGAARAMARRARAEAVRRRARVVRREGVRWAGRREGVGADRGGYVADGSVVVAEARKPRRPTTLAPTIAATAPTASTPATTPSPSSSPSGTPIASAHVTHSATAGRARRRSGIRP